ncbi:MAG: tRNA epoxyqueuosine(34) reductase QueG [Anaerolineales bacterium]
MISSQRLKSQALALGFNLIGLTPARPAPHLRAYFQWIEAHMHGAMGYLAREDRQARRRDLNAILPGVRSLVIVGLDYHTLELPESLLADPARGRIAAYAWGRDYHDLMLPRLKALAEWLRGESGGEIRYKAYVDTGAILERSHAQQAGLGFVGKNTMLIHPRRGSDFFLGEILTDANFDAYDQPGREGLCGTCARCLAACPTNAFPQPYVLDARRCISYLTIEHPAWVERDLRPLMGNWVFGCDVCQTVCPWQRFAVQTHESSFFPISPDRAAPKLAELLALDPAGFERMFRGTPVERIGRDQLVRNACIAAGNSGITDLVLCLEELLTDPAPLVRGHAAWALARLGAARLLEDRLRDEPEADVRREIQANLWG